jgi:competence protein CoiA
MKYAIYNDEKIEPQKGATGFCPCCGSELIARCGEIKIHHWAHKGNRECDAWWEPETEWHRAWKSHFHSDWQEVIHKDELTGEKHIADVKTDKGLVVEFQHSYINAEERKSRESFYKNMIWIVDGTRLKRDFKRFFSAKESLRPTVTKGVFSVNDFEELFPIIWTRSSVPVVFDFKGFDQVFEVGDWRNYYYYLIPYSDLYGSLVVILSHENLLSILLKSNLLNVSKNNDERLGNISMKSFNVTGNNRSQYIMHKGRFIKKRRL